MYGREGNISKTYGTHNKKVPKNFTIGRSYIPAGCTVQKLIDLQLEFGKFWFTRQIEWTLKLPKSTWQRLTVVIVITIINALAHCPTIMH